MTTVQAWIWCGWKGVVEVPRLGGAICGPREFLTQIDAERALDVPRHLTGVPALTSPRHPLDLARRQTQRLAQLADCATRTVRRERGDERRAIPAVSLVDARDQLLTDIPGEVEIDVRERGQLLVEEPPDHQRVLDRVDVREAGEVADDRGDA